jgi:hypothetical protein
MGGGNPGPKDFKSGNYNGAGNRITGKIKRFAGYSVAIKFRVQPLGCRFLKKAR